MITLELIHCLDLGIIISCLGIMGILVNKRSMLITLISVELMLYGLDFFAIVASLQTDEIAGQLFALFILTVAAAESAIALAIIMSYFKLYGNIIIELEFEQAQNR